MFLKQPFQEQSMFLEQSCQEQLDAKLRLLSVTSSSGGTSSPEVEGVRSSTPCGHRLTVLTLIMVFGVLSWGCAAAAAVLERRTLAGTVAACFYAVCTSTVAVLLTVLQSPIATSHPTSRRSWRLFSRSGCLEHLTSWRNFCGRRTDGDAPRQPRSKQVVYSIASSGAPAVDVCTTLTVQAGDELDCITDTGGQEVMLGMRDCTGSSCLVPASLSAAQLPVSTDKCKECRCYRSATDVSTDSRCLSRNSTRMKDFDDISLSSDDDKVDNYYNGCAEGRWWNGDVDVDGCSIHRAPCPSPASACSARAADCDGVDRSSESGTSRQHPAAGWSTQGRGSRRRSVVVGASPGTSRGTQRRPRYEDETEKTRYRRQRKTKYSHAPGTECVWSASIDRCTPGLIAHQQRRRISSKPRHSYCDT